VRKTDIGGRPGGHPADYKKTLKKLYNFSQLLTQNNIKHWLDWGALLHGYRDKELHDDDVDFGLLKRDWDKVRQLLQDNNISVYNPGDPSLIRLLNSPGDVGTWPIDMYFWDFNPTVSNLPEALTYVLDGVPPVKFSPNTIANAVHRYLRVSREAVHLPRSALFCLGVDPDWPNRQLRRTKKYFIQELDKLDIDGYEFPVPRYLEKFLLYRYGTQWRSPMTKDQHEEYLASGAEEKHFVKEDNITVLVEGVWDLFHQGHVELLKRVHDIYDRVVVGIASDDLVRSYKRDPIIPYDDRVKMLEACKYVDEIYHNAPCLNITEKALDECGADYALHSVNDPTNWKTELREKAKYSQSLIDSGRAHFLSYTDYHTTDIIDKILKDNK